MEKKLPTHLNYSRIRALQDQDQLHSLEEDLMLKKIRANHNIFFEYANIYKNWISSTQVNRVVGFSDYKYCVYSAGVTQAIDHFIIRHASRRIRYFAGEYVYTEALCKSVNHKSLDLELDVLETDAIIISLPFSSTGNTHDLLGKLFSLADEKKIPTFIDCAYFGTTKNVIYDFSNACIEAISFSLSKSTPLWPLRLGIRFQDFQLQMA